MPLLPYPLSIHIPRCCNASDIISEARDAPVAGGRGLEQLAALQLVEPSAATIPRPSMYIVGRVDRFDPYSCILPCSVPSSPRRCLR